ncbi:hypothetical protein [Nocardioides stalactiti]|uniref:hypothetical protein n=1 Tax=Nocardioides stalactiti TaxID=2755356 RepID=UPI0015FED51E|nr:hypothetical protein [Nocardioides stalactiti]
MTATNADATEPTTRGTAAQETDEKPWTLGEKLSAAGFLLAFYVLVGLVWADSHVANFDAFGIEKPITYAAHVAAWPLLIFVDLDVLGLHLT